MTEQTDLATRAGAVVATVPGFEHLHAAHCESGVTSLLMTEVGTPITEPLLFGVGSGIFFGHLPFVKVMGNPLTTFRSLPGSIFKKACQRLGVRHRRETFARPGAGMQRLDALVDQGVRVGLQVNIYWLPYIPPHMRVHFNGHNLMVLGRRGDTYLVSDPVLETPFECPRDDLERARFSGGNRLLGRGLLYYPSTAADLSRLPAAIEQGLAESCHRMLRIPRVFPWFGARGIQHLAGQIPTWERRVGARRAQQWAAGLVRMQEEVGTGGAGFRYLFAAFLQQAAEHLGWDELQALSEQTTQVGDQWRRFALHTSRLARGRGSVTWSELGEELAEVAGAERELWQAIDGVRQAGPRQLTG